MKILIDMSNSPHVLFFNPIIKELENLGHRVYITAREHAQTRELLELYGKKHKIIGKHAGKSIVKKLLSSFSRVLLLSREIEKINPDICISHQSPYITYASFLKGKDNIYIFDNEKAKMQNALTFPFAKKIMCPDPISMKSRRLIKYPGIKEGVYLCDWNYRKVSFEKTKKKKILIRTEINEAAYHSGKTVFELVKKLSKKYSIIISPRNKIEVEKYKPISGLTILEKPLDGPSLMKNVDLVMSAGGTMNREAAVIGKPVISLYSGELLNTDKYLIAHGLMTHIPIPDEQSIDRVIKQKTKSDYLLKAGIDAKKKIIENIVGKRKNKIMFVVASRPNFMKVAPLVKESIKLGVDFSIFYIEQHKSKTMTGSIAEDLELPSANYFLGINKNGINKSKFVKGLDLARGFARARKIIKKDNPSWVVVVGDVISSAYVAIIAKICGFKVAHVEAGLRSFNNKMPEEKARRTIDKISDLFFTTEEKASLNLIKEGKNREDVLLVGNLMIDSLLSKINESKNIKMYEKFELKRRDYAVLTFHRHENITKKAKLIKLIEILYEITKKIRVVFPLHPSTKKQLIRFGLLSYLEKNKNLKLIDPLGYQDMLSIVYNSKFVLTDSGGLQEETTVLKIPCLTLRAETERPITVDIGTNTIVGLDKEIILKNILNILNNKYKIGKIPNLWDGKTAKRIINVLKCKL